MVARSKIFSPKRAYMWKKTPFFGAFVCCCCLSDFVHAARRLCQASMVGLRISQLVMNVGISLGRGSDDQAHEQGSTFAITLPAPMESSETELSKVDKQARRCSKHGDTRYRLSPRTTLLLVWYLLPYFNLTLRISNVRRSAKDLGGSSA